MVMEPVACCGQGQDDGWSTHTVQAGRMAEVHFRVVKMLIWVSQQKQNGIEKLGK